ncbi:TetR/AcrR family transcriptional regulator [Mariniluteicoccus flavus]
MGDPATTRPRRRLLPAERRSEILTSATELISAVGFNATTIDQFAAAAQISRPGLLHHFPSKEALLEAVLTRRDGDTLEALQRDSPAGTPTEAREITHALVRWNAERPELTRLYTILAAEALSPDHPAYAYFRTRQRRVQDLFAAKVVAWHADPPAAALQVIAHLDGLQLHWLRDPTIDIVDQWDAFAAHFFTGDDATAEPTPPPA